jgi:hypothetical protein
MLPFVGNGALFEGDIRLGDASYVVEITPSALPGGLTRISGQITATEIDLFGLFIRNPPPRLTLHMEDDVRWECGLANIDGRLHPVGVPLYRMVAGERVPIRNI